MQNNQLNILIMIDVLMYVAECRECDHESCYKQKGKTTIDEIYGREVLPSCLPGTYDSDRLIVHCVTIVGRIVVAHESYFSLASTAAQ